MAENLFEKYGIKEVADVTFYRIDKKKQTFEAQREITAASILKGVLETRTVYPMIDGMGDTEGFDALVFADANILKHTNYDCDDTLEGITAIHRVEVTTEEDLSEVGEIAITITNPIDGNAAVSAIKEKLSIPASDTVELISSTILSAEKTEISDSKLENYNATTTVDTKITVALSPESDIETNNYIYNVTITNITATSKTDGSTGVLADGTGKVADADYAEEGTHEFTYAEQVLMIFAKAQNLIKKDGTRYRFTDYDIFGNIEFNDEFAAGPSSTEKVVVVGLPGLFTENTYDIEDVNDAIKELTTTYSAKAYDVVYNDYAELVVEDEMGYFAPKFLGKAYNSKTKTVTFFKDKEYAVWAKSKKGVDKAIRNAKTWGDGIHYSINDAIDALKQKKALLDTATDSSLTGIKNIFGGYKVTDKALPVAGDTDLKDDILYTYSIEGNEFKIENTVVISQYSLDAVIEALEQIAYEKDTVGKEIFVGYEAGKESNRAIYVGVGDDVDLAAGAYIYLLHNRNYRALAADELGIFSFEDKKGNTLFYQDKIFAGTEYLALVVVGDQGLIYVVNRHGSQNVTRTAWMINENGYVAESKLPTLVKSGLIHTTDITVNDETFEATCSVHSMALHKTIKNTKHYTPVLFLDTLKVSTIEQTAEEVYATGGQGNANLIGWNYNKEITLQIEDALFTPASMSAIFGDHSEDFRKGVKEAKTIDRMEKVTAKRSFIVPAGNSKGTPTEADKSAQAVFYDPTTMEPYADGTPIAEGEVFYKFTRSVAYKDGSLGNLIEISANKFPGTYKVVGDTFVRSKDTGEDERFQFVLPECKMQGEQTITLEADGDPTVNYVQSNAVVKIA